MEGLNTTFSNVEIKKILLAFAPKIEYRELYIETLDRILPTRTKYAKTASKSLNAIKNGYFYIIKANDLIKIGITKNLKQRFEAYKVHNPNVEILHIFESPFYERIEKDVIGILKREGIIPVKRAEWFSAKLLPLILETFYLHCNIYDIYFEEVFL